MACLPDPYPERQFLSLFRLPGFAVLSPQTFIGFSSYMPCFTPQTWDLPAQGFPPVPAVPALAALGARCPAVLPRVTGCSLRGVTV